MSNLICQCSTCSEAVHVYHDQKSLLKNNLKLLEQAHCAHCWRPLRVPNAWPGPREGQRPPYGNGAGAIVVAQCGHIYHGNCASKLSHCGLCFASLQKLIPLHYQDMSRRHNAPSETAPTITDPKPEPESSLNETRDTNYLEDLITNLRHKMEDISAEVVQFRQRLLKAQTPPKRWR